jgi:hypothetical protein
VDTISLTWSLVDKLYYLCTRLEYVNKQENIFRVRLIRYRGKSLQLSDGTNINPQDLLVKIHLHNCQLMREMQEMEGQIKRALYVYDRVLESLPGLASFVDHHPCKDRIKGVLGITLLHRGIKRLGFDAIEIPNPLYLKAKQMYLLPMFWFLHPGSTTQQKDKLKPKFITMSKQKLLHTYGKNN